MTDDQIIAHTAKLHALRPTLRPLDWRILGEVIRAGAEGLPQAVVRRAPDTFGSLTAFTPAVQRLIDAGLVARAEVAYPSTDYRGKEGRGPKLEVIFTRTATPINPAIL